MTVETYYTVLGIEETASQAEIKSAYRDLVRRVHPDSVPNGCPYWKRAAEEKTKEINEAFDVLSTELKRREYDRQLAEARQQVPLQTPSKQARAATPMGVMDLVFRVYGSLIAAGIAFVLLRILWVSLLSSAVAYKRPATTASTNQPPAQAVTQSVADSVTKDPPEVPTLPAPQSKLPSLTFTEQQSIEAACSDAKYDEGPAAYNRCLDRQLQGLAAGPRQPDLSGLTPSDQQSIESACSSAKYGGPAAYNRCLVRQLEELNSYYHLSTPCGSPSQTCRTPSIQ